MQELEDLKNLTIEEIQERLDKNQKKVKITRAMTYVVDVIIIMVAFLYVFDVNFSKWLMLPAASSVSLHSRLAQLYQSRCKLKQQKIILECSAIS